MRQRTSKCRPVCAGSPNTSRSLKFFRFCLLVVVAAACLLSQDVCLAAPTDATFVNFEGKQTHPVRLSPDGTRLFAVNTPDARLSVFAVSGSSSGDFATVVYRDVPPVSIDLISTGVRLRVTGVPVRSYNVERAPAVTGPWSTINTQTAPASGLLEHLDTMPHSGSGFYRIVQP